MKRVSVKTNISDAISKGESLLTQGRLDEAEITLQSALQSVASETTSASALSKGNILSSLSVVQKRRGRHDKVLRSLKLLLRHIVENNLGRFEEAITLVNIGTTLYFLGKIDLSLVYTMKACRGLQRLSSSSVILNERDQQFQTNKRKIVSNQVLSSFNMAVIQQALDNSVESMRWLNAAKSMAITNFGFRQKITELVTRSTELKDKQAKPFFLHLKFEDGSYSMTANTDDKFMSDDQGRADEARSAITADSAQAREHAQISALAVKKKIGSARPPGIVLPQVGRKIYSSRENTVAGEPTIENGSLDRFPRLRGGSHGINLLDSPKRSTSAEQGDKEEVVGVQVVRISSSAEKKPKSALNDLLPNTRSKSTVSEPAQMRTDKSIQTSNEGINPKNQAAARFSPMNQMQSSPYSNMPVELGIGQTTMSDGSSVLGSQMRDNGYAILKSPQSQTPTVPNITIPAPQFQNPQVNFPLNTNIASQHQDPTSETQYPWLQQTASAPQQSQSFSPAYFPEQGAPPAVPQVNFTAFQQPLNYNKNNDWMLNRPQYSTEQSIFTQVPASRLMGAAGMQDQAPLTRVGQQLPNLPADVGFGIGDPQNRLWVREQSNGSGMFEAPQGHFNQQSVQLQSQPRTYLPWPPLPSGLAGSAAEAEPDKSFWGPPQVPTLPMGSQVYNTKSYSGPGTATGLSLQPQASGQNMVQPQNGSFNQGNPNWNNQLPSAKPVRLPPSSKGSLGSKNGAGKGVAPAASGNPVQRGLALISSQAQTSAGGSGKSSLPASKRSSIDKLFEKKYGIARFEQGVLPMKGPLVESGARRDPETMARMPDLSTGERRKQLEIDRLNITLRYMG